MPAIGPDDVSNITRILNTEGPKAAAEAKKVAEATHRAKWVEPSGQRRLFPAEPASAKTTAPRTDSFNTAPRNTAAPGQRTLNFSPKGAPAIKTAGIPDLQTGIYKQELAATARVEASLVKTNTNAILKADFDSIVKSRILSNPEVAGVAKEAEVAARTKLGQNVTTAQATKAVERARTTAVNEFLKKNPGIKQAAETYAKANPGVTKAAAEAQAKILASNTVQANANAITSTRLAAVEKFATAHPKVEARFFADELAKISKANPKLTLEAAEAQAKIAAQARIDSIVRTKEVTNFLKANPNIASKLASNGASRSEVYAQADKLLRARSAPSAPSLVGKTHSVAPATVRPNVGAILGQRPSVAVQSYIKSNPGVHQKLVSNWVAKNEARLIAQGVGKRQIARIAQKEAEHLILNRLILKETGGTAQLLAKPSAELGAKTGGRLTSGLLGKMLRSPLGINGVIGMYNNLFNSSESSMLGRLFSFAVDGMAIASIFMPQLILPVAALYVARGAWSILNGGTLSGLMDIGFALLPFARALKAMPAAMKALGLRGGLIQTAQKAVGNVGAKQVKWIWDTVAKSGGRARNIMKGAGRWADNLGKNVANYAPKAAAAAT